MSKCTNSKLTACDICGFVIQDHYWLRVDNFDVHAKKPCLKKVIPEIRRVLERFDIGNSQNHHPKQIGLIESQEQIEKILSHTGGKFHSLSCTYEN